MFVSVEDGTPSATPESRLAVSISRAPSAAFIARVAAIGEDARSTSTRRALETSCTAAGGTATRRRAVILASPR
jgi:hypothetical protein